MRFHKKTVNTDCHGSAREHRHKTAVAARTRALSAGQLHRVRGVKDDRRLGFTHNGKTAHVAHQVAVAKARPSLADHEVVGLQSSSSCRLTCLCHNIDHVVRRQKLPLFNVHRLPAASAGLDEVRLTAQKGRRLKNINDRLFLSAERLRQEQRLIVTWGTAWAYRLKSSGKIVANCHKLPDKLFERELLSVRQIVTEWKELLLSLWEQHPELRILFTISPIRHWKDGAHGNQISKATLLLAVHELEQTFPEHIAYFPAYEIMMDELRDYRLYADDMLHPSEQAVEYFWETFARHLFTQETKKILQAWSHIQKALQHKPFHPESETYKQFLSQTLLKMERLTEKFPYFDLEKEITKIKETSSNNMFQP